MTNTGLRESSFQDRKRTQEDPHVKLREISHYSQSEEEITCGQTDCVDDF